MDLAKAVWGRFSERRGTTLAAAIGYRAVFALAPLLVVVVSGAGMVFGEDAAQGLLSRNLSQFLGPEMAATIQDFIATARGQGGVGLAGTLLLLWAGSGLFNELQGSMASIFGLVRPKGIRRAVKQRLITVAAVVALALGFAVLVAMAAWIPMSGSIVVAGAAAAFLLVSVVIGFRYLSQHRPEWRLTVAVAGGTVLAMALAALAVGLFVIREDGGSATGIAGSATAVLLLVYALSAVFLLGAAALRELELRGGPPSSRQRSSAL
ncbi:N/A [soil metagenome]